MKTFKQYLVEMNYGSLINQEKYNEMDKADKALYKYTADAFTPVSHVIDTLIERYPFEGGTLYRGLHFGNQEQHDKFLATIQDGKLEIGSTSSWTPDKSTAQDFAHSKKSYFPTPELMFASEKMRKTGDHMSGYGGVVLKTKVGKGKGVDLSKTDYQKEREVILPEGTYNVVIEELTEPYSRQYDTPEKVQNILNDLKKAKARDPALDKKANYVRMSWAKKLAPEQADILMRYMSIRFLTMPPTELAQHSISFKIDKDFFDKNSHRLDLEAWAGIDEELYELCTEKMQALIDKRIKIVVKALASAIKQIASHENVGELDDFRISGIRELAKYFPDEVADAIKPLRKVLANRYHIMNSRETSKKLTTDSDIRKHAEKIGKVVQAMSQL